MRHTVPRQGLLVCGLALLMAACSTPRSAPPPMVTWRHDVKPLLAAQCVSCHSGETPAGSYTLDTYLGTLGNGSDDTANAIAGEAKSKLLTILASGDHAGYLAADDTTRKDRLDLLTRWVVDDKLAYFDSLFHEPGILDPADPQFHGRLVAAAGWSFTGCQRCHGTDFEGGFVNVSCTRCHQDTPEACDTCHGTGSQGFPPPDIIGGRGAGAHAAHRDSADEFAGVACSSCHQVPSKFTDPVHIHKDGRAVVTFSGLATARGATPSYDPATGKCSDVACHGAGLTGGTLTSPSWTTGDAAKKCGACHGVPPQTLPDGKSHPSSDRCELCHGMTAGPGKTIADPTHHNDGTIDVLAGLDTCSACHSAPSDPPPFHDVSGSTDRSRMTVGAHDAHVQGGIIRTPLACDACHAVPQKIDSAGHLDVEPAQITFGTLAKTDGLSPSFDAASGTCQNVYCHGATLDGGQTTTPVWNDPTASLICGSCHGMPPATLRNGSPHPQATTCGACHGRVIDDSFQWVDQSLHIDGTVEVGP